MAKKFSLLLAAIAVVAFAVPTFASAAELTDGGAALPVGSELTGTSTDAETETPLGTLTCGKVTVGGRVTQNSGGTVAGVGNGESSTTSCVIDPEKQGITIENIQLTGISATSPTSGSASFSFKANVPGLPEGCVFSGTVPGTCSSGTDTLFVNGTGLEGTPSICGENGEVTFRGHFALTTKGTSTPIIID
jgi:hypothetical protein